ncbi:MAG TPA: lipopolysaccharide biosynthesis protein [Solirubrobacterales bacterium]
MLFRNTLAQSSAAMVGYIASLILAPILLARLGIDAFGLWAVTGAMVTYARTLDLGVGRSLSRFVALFESQGDRRGVEECVGLGLAAVTLLLVVGLIAAVALAGVVSDLLDVETTSEMRIVLVSSVVLGMSYAYSQVLAAVPIGMREMVPPNVANTLMTLVNFVFSLVALALSDRLPTYAVANAAAGVVGLVPFVVVLVRVWDPPYAAWPTRKRVREVIGYGIKGQTTWIADLVNMETDKIIIAVLLGVGVAGAFEIGARVAVALRAVGVQTVSAIIPTATAEIVRRGKEVIPEFYRRYLKLTVGLSFPLFGVGCVTAPFLLVAWLHEVPDDSQTVLVFLSLAYAVTVTTGVGSTLAMAEGRPGLVAVYAVVAAGTNVGLTVALAPLFGLWGVLAGTVISAALGSLLFVRAYNGLHVLNWIDYLGAVLPAAGLCLVLSIPAGLWYLFGPAVPDQRLPALIGTVVFGLLFMVPYWLISSRLGLIPGRLAPSRVLRLVSRS